MSTFQVQLNNASQGRLDVDINNVQKTTSIQRSVFIQGPNLVHREIKDGDTFIDCNYYKRYCYPQVSLENAILTCTHDDGSPWVDGSDNENVVAFSYNLSTAGGSAYVDNQADIITDYGTFATFCEITNTHASDSVSIRLNGTAAFTLLANSTRIFNTGDLPITIVEVANDTEDTVVVEVVGGVKSISNS